MLTYDMNARGDLPLYEYLYQCIKYDIKTGNIAAHAKLPSKRALAQNLGVSVITVEGAYAQLLAEGYIRAESRRGYFANALPITPEQQTSAKKHKASQIVTQQNSATSNPHRIDLTGKRSATGLFPYSVWAKVLREVLSSETEISLLSESEGAGSLQLRTAISEYLRGSRGMNIEPSQVIIGAGAQYLYGLIAQLAGHSTIAVEDPGYAKLTRIYNANGMNVAHIPLDKDGMRMDALKKSGANIAHIMPSHQFPTGLVTSISRRYELLEWAEQDNNRYIIEDDYDCELRLAGKPVPSLQSIASNERVIYVNTFSKTLGPAFRIGYMILPKQLVPTYKERLGFYSCTVSAIDQLTLARFIESGGYERHINRTRSFYRGIRDTLVDALRNSPLGPRLSFASLDSGIHFLLGINSKHSDEELSALAAQHDVDIRSLSSFCIEHAILPNNSKWLVVSYAGLTEESITAAVEALCKAWKE